MSKVAWVCAAVMVASFFGFATLQNYLYGVETTKRLIDCEDRGGQWVHDLFAGDHCAYAAPLSSPQKPKGNS